MADSLPDRSAARNIDRAIEALGSVVAQCGGEGDEALDLVKDALASNDRLRAENEALRKHQVDVMRAYLAYMQADTGDRLARANDVLNAVAALAHFDREDCAGKADEEVQNLRDEVERLRAGLVEIRDACEPEDPIFITAAGVLVVDPAALEWTPERSAYWAQFQGSAPSISVETDEQERSDV